MSLTKFADKDSIIVQCPDCKRKPRPAKIGKGWKAYRNRPCTKCGTALVAVKAAPAKAKDTSIQKPKKEEQKKKTGRPLKFETPEEMEEAINEYFKNGAYVEMGDKAKVFLPTVTGLAIALNMDRRTFVNYANRDEFLPTIKRARARIEESLERRLHGSAVAGVIFNLKNNFNWKDKIEQDTTNRVTIVADDIDEQA